MATLDTLIKRNEDFVAHRFTADWSGLPLKLRTVIITCVDPRVDPASLLGLEPGEAVVVRNIGGRITLGALQILDLLGKVAQVVEADYQGEFNLIVLHHTDCGIRLLDKKHPDMLADYFDIDQEELEATKAPTDPQAAVAIDVAALRAYPELPSGWLVSGLVYDVETGLVETVVSSTV